MRQGKFVTFEGCEGVGKTSQIRRLCRQLDEWGVEYVSTREPGGSAVAEQIRNIILDAKNAEMCDICEALLYSAARAQHLAEIVLPALQAGKLVLCDRFIDSTYAYQGVAKGLGEDLVRRLNEIAVGDCKPDLTIFFDLDPERAFARKGGRDPSDRLESLSLEFHKKVYEGYKKLAVSEPERFVAIPADGEKEQTHNRVLTLLLERGFVERKI